MNSNHWEEIYKFAMLEVDGRKMPERISAADTAIRERLHELAGDSGHCEERARLEHALDALEALAIETQAWH